MRTEVTELLEEAAVADGFEPSMVGSHSLRIGGACSLYHQFGDIELVRRFGRWRSSAFHVYLWESREDTKEVAKGMAGDNTTLMAAKGLGAMNTQGGGKYIL